MLVAIDPGHGGSDPGAVYNGRQEKDDVLKLAKEVGRILENNGVDVIFTREGDIYETPFKKAQDANNAGADYFVSFHRNSSEYPNQYSGAEVLVYNNRGMASNLAENILQGMENAGFKNLGVDERKDLVVLRRTRMPAVLIEAGFINNDSDNQTFDQNFNSLAQGIADGVLNSLGYGSGAADGMPVNGNVVVVNDPYDNMDLDIPDEVYDNNGNNIDYEDERRYMNNGMYGEMMPNGNIMNGNMNNRSMGNMINGNMNDRSMDNMMNGNMSDRSMDNMMNGNMSDRSMDNMMNGNMNNIVGGPMNGGCNCPNVLYRVQVGAFRNRDSADRLFNSLLVEEFPAFIVFDDGLYKVQVGAYRNLSNAIAMENRLRQYRYNTYITTK